jgi:hypothetical protein
MPPRGPHSTLRSSVNPCAATNWPKKKEAPGTMTGALRRDSIPKQLSGIGYLSALGAIARRSRQSKPGIQTVSSRARILERSRAPRPVGLAGMEPNRKNRKHSKSPEAALTSLRSPCSRKRPRRRSRASFRSTDGRNAGTSESTGVAVRPWVLTWHGAAAHSRARGDTTNANATWFSKYTIPKEKAPNRCAWLGAQKRGFSRARREGSRRETDHISARRGALPM